MTLTEFHKKFGKDAFDRLEIWRIFCGNPMTSTQFYNSEDREFTCPPPFFSAPFGFNVKEKIGFSSEGFPGDLLDFVELKNLCNGIPIDTHLDKLEKILKTNEENVKNVLRD